MEPELERPEMQPIPAITAGSVAMPGQGERMPMPAGPDSAQRATGETRNRLGLAAAAILTAGLAAAIVFKGDLRPAQHMAPPAEPPATPIVQVQAPVARPAIKAPAEPPQFPELGESAPAAMEKPALDGFSGPQPFFNSSEAETIPKIAQLQPFNTEAPAQAPSANKTVLPAAAQLTPRLLPGGGNSATTPAEALKGVTSTVPGYCPACHAGAILGTKTRANALQAGEGKAQNEIATRYLGTCEGKYVYEYTNETSNMTIGMKILTGGGEVWTFTLKPGEKTSLKSSTQFTPGTYDSYRISEVIN